MKSERQDNQSDAGKRNSLSHAIDAPPAGEQAWEAALDHFVANAGVDSEKVVAQLLEAFPDRRSEIEAIVASLDGDEIESQSDVLPPLPGQVDLDSVAASGDETDREPAWTKHPAEAGPPAEAVTEQRPNPIASGHSELPRRLGGYELLKLIDSGGMGVVYQARSVAAMQRLVAIKVIKPEIGGKEILSRFALECQSLALMNHPSIATVYEGGVTQEGEPYLAMELVDGVSLSEFVQSSNLDLRARLELFRKICSGIEHAHQKGVIHRDLKPSNVLVTVVDGQPTPKVIDFGLAKITSGQSPTADESDTIHSTQTQLGQILGTLQYMSPEGAMLQPRAVDTRSDVFSLGVVLFELLTGTTPLAGQLSNERPIDERLRRVRSQEPMRPSDRLAALRRGGTDSGIPIALPRQLRGDLDAICLKALALEPDERYVSTGELSADVANYLAGHPVSAAVPNGTYMLRKFLHRYRASLAVAGVIAALLLVATGVSIRWAIRATNAEQELTTQLQVAVAAQEAETEALRKAEHERATAQAISDFLRLDLLGQASPIVGAGHDLTLREVLDKAAAEMGDRFDDAPRVKGELLATIASVYSDLGEYTTAQPYWIEAHQLLSQLADDDGYRAMLVNHAAALNCLRLGLIKEAEQRLKRNLKFLLENDGKWPDQLHITRTSLSLVMNRLGNEAEAADMQAALLIDAKSTGKSTLVLENNWAAELVRQRRYSQAKPILRRVYAASVEEEGRDSTKTMQFQANLAYCLSRSGEEVEAMSLFDDLAQRLERVLGTEHSSLLVNRQMRADCLRRQGNVKESVANLRSLIEDCKSRGLDLSYSMIRNGEHLAIGLFELAKDDEAIDVLFESARRYVAHYGKEHHVAIKAIEHSVNALNNHGQYRASRDLLSELWTFQDGNFDQSIALTDMSLLSSWLRAVREMKDWETLHGAAKRLLDIFPEHSDSWKSERAKVWREQGIALRATGQHAAAATSFREAFDTYSAILQDELPEALSCQLDLATELTELRQFDDAEQLLRDLNDSHIQLGLVSSKRGVATLKLLNQIADQHRDEGDFATAETLFEYLTDFCSKELGPSNRETLANWNGFGQTLRAYKTNEKNVEAERVFRHAIEQAGKPTKSTHSIIAPILSNLALTLKSLDRFEEAAQYYLSVADLLRTHAGRGYYRAEQADIHAAECFVLLDQLERGCELLEPLCWIDAGTPAKNIPVRLEAIDLLLKHQDASRLEETAMRIKEIFDNSSQLEQLDAWDRGKLAMAAAGTLRRRTADPEKLQIALELNRAAVVLRESEDPNDYRTSSAYRSLGVAFDAVGSIQSAEAAYLKAYKILTLSPPKSASRKRSINSVIAKIVDHYDTHAKPELANQWQAKTIAID